MEVIKITRGDGTVLEFEFAIPPTAAQLIAAMDGIGGRPRDREKLAGKNSEQQKD
jgi:hypothetical protein